MYNVCRPAGIFVSFYADPFFSLEGLVKWARGVGAAWTIWNAKVRITDLSHHAVLFERQYMQLHMDVCARIEARVHVQPCMRMYARTLAARTVKGLGYTPYVSLYRARSTFVPGNEYIRHGI